MKYIYIVYILIILFFSCKKSDIDSNLKEKELPLYDYTDKDIEEFYIKGNYDLVVLNYWAGFCTPCKKEMLDLQKIYNEYKDKNILIVGACIDEKDQVEFIKSILLSLNISYPNLYGVKPIFKGIEITGLPKTFIIEKDNIKFEFDGKRDYYFFKKVIEKNLVK